MALIFFLAAILLCVNVVLSSEVFPWENSADPPEVRAKLLLAQMTLAEKLAMLRGYGGSYVGNVPANTRLNIPAINMNDGPQGFRDDARPGTTTAFPSGLTVAASWDVQAMYDWGEAMGQEFFQKGSNVQLGPGLNVARVPVNGRNFEYLSGEDPFLGYILVQPVIRGIQSQHVVANAKHYIQNNQEYNRGSVSENVDERTAFEIYYPPFLGAIEAGVGSFMCSYNKINHVYSCENNQTLNVNLRDRLGFKGWVMSDWGATHSVSINQGLDQEMPGADFFGSALASAVNSGAVSQNTVDTSVLRIITPMFAVGLFDYRSTGNLAANVTSDAHNKLCRRLSGETTVLVKNERDLLPLSRASVSRIAVIGSLGVTPITNGGGSGSVTGPYRVSPANALRSYLGVPVAPPAPVSCNQITFEDNVDYYQAGNPSSPGSSAMDCCLQCSRIDWCNYFGYQKNEHVCWFKPDNTGRQASNDVISGGCRLAAPPAPTCNSDGSKCVLVSGTNDVNDAMNTARGADVAIVFVGTTSSEGSDRSNLQLGGSQDALVEAVGSVNPNTIVVVSTPGAILMPWHYLARSVLVNFMPGQEVGNAVVDLLFGDVNPSAKLPITIPNRDNEIGFNQSQYPGLNNGLNATYSEGLFVGYRWYDQYGVTPLFPFGHGLSYTRFQYSDISISSDNTVFATVTNVGSRTGAEVAQLYIEFPQSAGEPPKILRGFSKVILQPQQRATLQFPLPSQYLSIWDVTTHKWMPVRGLFKAHLGASSRDIRLSISFVV